MDPREVLAKLAESGTPPDAGSALRISVGLDGSIARFRDEILPFVREGGAELQFVFAPYGRGKTHYLRALQEVALREGFVTSYVDCRAGQSPFASLQETYRSMAKGLMPPQRVRGTKRRTGPDAVLEAGVRTVSPEEAKRRIERVYGDPLLASDFRTLSAAYMNQVLREGRWTQLTSELRALLRADITYRIRVSDLYRGNPHLPRPIGKLGRRNAASWVRSLASIPGTIGYPGLVVLFDETEQVHSMARLRPKARQTYLANLRNFVDHMALGTFRSCVIYYAVVEEFLETARADLEALSQRIERIRLGSNGEAPNPRAVWVDLDELTQPTPGEVAFFEGLAEAIVQVGCDAGLPGRSRDDLLRMLSGECAKYSDSIKSGAVREFVKMAASVVAAEVSRHV
ncbi:BREX system ATP-binding domain-containing protein [Deferrisoma palaeochoriense]